MRREVPRGARPPKPSRPFVAFFLVPIRRVWSRMPRLAYGISRRPSMRGSDGSWDGLRLISIGGSWKRPWLVNAGENLALEGD